MSKMYIVIGIPGSGKSYYIRNHAKDNDVIVSRDQIRFNLLKDGDDYFAKEKEVYDTFINQINAAVADGRDVWVDQTSINRGSRTKLFNRLVNKPDELIGIYFNVPVQVALQRNAQRTGRALVPEDSIISMATFLRRPTKDEGFTEIIEMND